MLVGMLNNTTRFVAQFYSNIDDLTPGKGDEISLLKDFKKNIAHKSCSS